MVNVIRVLKGVLMVAVWLLGSRVCCAGDGESRGFSLDLMSSMGIGDALESTGKASPGATALLPSKGLGDLPIDSNQGSDDRDRSPAEAPVQVTASRSARRHMVGGMTTTSWVLGGLFAVGGAAVLSNASADRAEQVGDVIQLLLPASAYSMTWIGRDGRGAVQYTKQLGTGVLTTYALKELVSKRTPTADDFNSFPSAHTQAAFSGASFIHRRFGPRWGVPAYVLATYTGFSRVKADRHYLDDVIGGMSIALISGWTFVDPIGDRVAINPLLVERGGGVTVSIKGSGSGGDGGPDRPSGARWRYTWEVGQTEVGTNLAQAPDGDGDTVDFRFRERNNPTMTSNLQIDRRIGARHEITARLAPFEVREEEHYARPVTFGGETFGPMDILDTRFVGYDLRFRWAFDLVPKGVVRVRAGAGLETLASLAEIEGRPNASRPEPKVGRGRELTLLPTLHLHLGLALHRSFLVYVEADGSRVGDDEYLENVAGLRWAVSRSWEVGGTYRLVDWSVSSAELLNDFGSDLVALTIGYRW
jgi:membrane-associated phospholipid phosphatase